MLTYVDPILRQVMEITHLDRHELLKKLSSTNPEVGVSTLGTLLEVFWSSGWVGWLWFIRGFQARTPSR